MVLTRKVLTFSLKFIPAHEGEGSVGLAMHSESVEAIFNTLILFKEHFAHFSQRKNKKTFKYFALFSLYCLELNHIVSKTNLFLHSFQSENGNTV